MSLVLGHALAETCLLIKHLAQGKALGKSLFSGSSAFTFNTCPEYGRAEKV